MSAKSPDGHMSPRRRVGIAFVVGILAGIVTGFLGYPKLSFLVGWDVAAAVFCIWIWAIIGPMSADDTERHAEQEDPRRQQADALLLTASVASLVAVAFLLDEAGKAKGAAVAVYAGLAAFSVLASWTVVHTRFTLRYAHLYYSGENGGVDFNTDDDPPEAPNFLDFAYLAFTIGMTFQVSDTSLKTRAFRLAALQHALLSYLFGTVIVATTINLVAGLGK